MKGPSEHFYLSNKHTRAYGLSLGCSLHVTPNISPVGSKLATGKADIFYFDTSKTQTQSLQFELKSHNLKVLS